MSKFTKQYTTKEQSERLLKLGIPAWTADCYFTKDFAEDNMVVFIDPKYEIDKCNRYPCWSTGRLIELWIVCNEYDFAYELVDFDPRYLINEIDNAIMNEMWNMDKLGKYKEED